MTRRSIAIGLALVALAGCAKARHVAVVADQTLAASVFAVDDAERRLCQQNILPANKCDELRPTIIQLLRDVDALSAALQVTPKDGPLPRNLPSLLAGLNTIDVVLTALGDGPQFRPLADRVHAANTKLIALVAQFAGGQ